jgi:hypothetical protein
VEAASLLQAPVELIDEVPKTYNIETQELEKTMKVLNLTQQKVLNNIPIYVTSLQQCIRTTKNQETAVLHNVTIMDENTILQNLPQGITLCSDGGAKEGKGSFGIAYIINTQITVTCSNRISDVQE